MDETSIGYGMGWLPDLPDFRDYNVETDIYRRSSRAPDSQV